MLPAINPLAAPQPTAYSQPRREGISSGAKLTWLVGILAFTIFGGGFFAILLADPRRHGSFTPQHPLANRASRRDVCTDTPIGVPTGLELTLTASHELGSHYLVRGADGKYLQTWINTSISSAYGRYRLIDTEFNPGGVIIPPSPYGGGVKTAPAGWKKGGYDLFAISHSPFSVYIESTSITSTGIAGTNDASRITTDKFTSNHLLSIASLPSGDAAICTGYTSIKSPYNVNLQLLRVYNSSGLQNSYQIDSSLYNSLISCSALDNGNIIYFWRSTDSNYNSTILGTVVTKTNNVVVPKKAILSLDINSPSLASTVLFNQKVVLAWVDPSTSRIAFQIMDATLSNPTGVIIADPCSSSIQSDPQLINFWDGFILVLTSDDASGKGVYGYRFGPDGIPIGGRFPLNSSTSGDQTNPILAPLGSSGIYTGWSSTTANVTSLVSRPFDLDSAPVINDRIPSQITLAGNLFNLNLTGYIQDPDIYTGFDNLTYSLLNTPPWLSFNNGTLIASGIPGGNNIGNQTVTFRGDDLHGKSVSQSFVITVNNQAPYIAWQPDDVQLALSSYFYLPLDRVFKDHKGTPINITVTGNPSWLAFANQILSGTASLLGLSTLNITGTDPWGASNHTSFTLEVVPEATGNHPPQVNALIASITKDGGTPFTYTIPSNAFTDIDGDPLTYYASLPNNAPLPSWLLFDQELGAFTGNPRNADAGEYLIVVRAIDPSGASTLQTFTMTIKDTTNLPPYVIAPLPATTAFVGQLFQQYVGGIFVDPNAGDALTLSVSFSPDVTWITFDPVKASLSGTPGHGDVFPVSAIFIARDKSGLSATSTVTINVQGDNWFIYIFKIVGPIFSVLGALATIYKYRHQIRDYTVLLKRKITPIKTSQGAITLTSVTGGADAAPLLQDASTPFNDGSDKA